MLIIDAQLFIHSIYTQLSVELAENGLSLDNGSFLHHHMSLRSYGQTGSGWHMTVDKHTAGSTLKQMDCSSEGPQLRLNFKLLVEFIAETDGLS